VGCYDTWFIVVNPARLRPRPGLKNDSEDIAIIAAYMDYLMNYEENKPDDANESSTALNRWRAFGLQKGVLRV
ncbi:MAG: acetyl-CoA carboxylase biotin carboxylase subunit, partial [Bacteroidales bacterium]|nr:acetyl-CoA carboxylase biotin carboxylase subunit [Bacteroidales bacterium]